MQRPRREEFILAVRRSARMLVKPNEVTDSTPAVTDAIANTLYRAALWLTPRVVEFYSPEDFTDWQQDQQDRLRRAIEDFSEIASQIPSDEPATIEQFEKGSRRFHTLIDVLGDMVLEEWQHAIKTVQGQAENWAAEVGWRSRRVNKKISESLIGTYEAPQLLIFAEPDLYVLDPLARFVPGGQGAFDLAIQPSYDATSLFRDDSGKWYIHLEIHNGVSRGKREAWSHDAFHQCIEQLRAFV